MVTAVGTSARSRRPEQASAGRVAVVGLGFAGLPTAVAIADAGFQTIGLDIDSGKVARINAGEPASGVEAGEIMPLVADGLLGATTDPAALATTDVIVISVPTPIDLEGRPDVRALEAACRTARQHAQPGTLVVLQSTVVPGTTRRLLAKGFEDDGHVVGRDIYVAFSPERINPGDPVYRVSNTTRLVAGATEACLERARAFVADFIESVRPVPSLEAAELAKLVENTFRFINISFVNELALLCDRIGVPVWDVIEAAATKPFAFMAHYPGPGIGGECIPVSPRYLEASALEHGIAGELIPAGYRATERMPDYVVDRCAKELGVDSRDLAGLKIVVVGVAYKPNVADTRHSPAVSVIHRLRERGASVIMFDPLVDHIVVDGVSYVSADPAATWPAGPVGADAAIVVTPHSDIDYAALASRVRLVLDARNAIADRSRGRVVAL